MDRLASLRIFTKVVEAESYTAAPRSSDCRAPSSARR